MTALEDALAEYDEFALGSVESLMSFEPVLATAARRVAEAPEVWWCEEHDATNNIRTADDRWACDRWWLTQSRGTIPEDCRMVRKLLVDP